MKRLLSSSKYLFYLFLFGYSFLTKAQIELISNGNFESSYNNGWITSDFGVIYTNYANANSGQKYGTMPVSGGNAQNSIGGRLSQTFFIPANTTNLWLSFYTKISTDEPDDISPYDKMVVTLKDEYGNISETIVTLSNLNRSSYYVYRSFGLSTTLKGQWVTLEFRATNDNIFPTNFRIDDVSIQCEVSTSCVQWVNGEPEQAVKEAAEFLCNIGIIDSYQNVNTLNNQFNLIDACKIVCNSLGNPEGALTLENFPTPFLDLESLTQPEKRAVKAMLYLERGDGTAPLSRDFYWIYPYRKPTIGQLARLVLEAWNFNPDFTGSDSNSNSSSSFSCDVKVNDYYYGWLRKAHNDGFFNNLYNYCNCSYSTNCLAQTYSDSPWKALYVLLFKALTSPDLPTNTPESSFYKPNNLTIESSGNEADISKAVFNSYTQNSFSIPGQGLSLDFSHYYSSNLLELPVMPIQYENVKSFWDNAISTLNPLGMGWSHNYNSLIQRLYEYNPSNSSNEDKKLSIHWADGTVHIYDIATNKYETKGVFDKLEVNIRVNGNPTRITITKPNQIKYVFVLDNEILKLVYITDRNDNTQMLAYEPRYCSGFDSGCKFASTRLKTVIDIGTSRHIDFSYQTNSNYVSSVTDGTRVIRFTMYNDGRTLRYYHNANNERTTYQYCDLIDCSYLLTSIILPKGNTITNTYEKRKLKQTTNNNYKIDVEFEPKYQTASVSTDTKVTITKNNNQVFSSTYSHNKYGGLTSIKSNTEDVFIRYNYNQPTLPEEITDNKTNIKEVFFYDFNGNVVRHERHAQNTEIAELSYFNDKNDIIGYRDAKEAWTWFDYDVKGNLKEIRGPEGDTTKFEVNSHGLVVSSSNPSHLVTRFEYNNYGNLNRIKQNIDANIEIISEANYDNVSRIIGLINPKGIRTNYSYDFKDNVKTVLVDPSNLNIPTNYNYDPNDNLTEIINAKGNKTTLTYDTNTDDLIKEEFGGDFRTWTYNTDGTTNTFTNKNGNIFNYLYYEPGDAREGLLKNDGYAQYDYYPESKKVKTVTKDGKTLTYYYDIFLRVSKIDYNDFNGNSVEYSYDNNDNITRITYPGTTNRYIDYSYDKNNRLTKIIDWQSRILVQYTYLADGRLLSETLGNGTKSLYSYDAIGRLDSIAIQKSNGSLLAYFATKLDANGNIIREARNEVENASFPNLTAINSTYTTDASNRLRDVDGTTINYDKAGNQTAVGSGQFTFDSENKLLSAPSPNGNLTFEYDPLGNRRKQNTTRYVLDILNNSNVLMDTDQSGSPINLYVHGNGLVCRYDITSNTYSYYHFDMRGSTVAITDAGGITVTHKYQYGPFGESLQSTESFPQPFRYVGKFGVMTDASNLYFMRARYYNPSSGRFLSEDPVWSTNLYPYADNNPIIKIDPYGAKSVKINQLVNSISNWLSNAFTARKLFFEFATGTGSQNHTFNNDRVANSFRNAKGVAVARDYWYWKANSGKDLVSDPVTGYPGNFGLKGALNAGIDPIEQYVGGYRIESIKVKGANLQYTITNQTSMNSFAYHIAPSWKRSSFKPFGNTYQTYIFTETINYQLITDNMYLKR